MGYRDLLYDETDAKDLRIWKEVHFSMHFVSATYRMQHHELE